MLPGKLAITIKQHSTFSLPLWWKDPRGRARNLTGWSARLQFRESPGSAVLKTLSTAGGGITITAATGKILLTMTDEETGLLNFATASYDLMLTDPTGQDWALLEGKVKLTPSITRPTP